MFQKCLYKLLEKEDNSDETHFRIRNRDLASYLVINAGDLHQCK